MPSFTCRGGHIYGNYCTQPWWVNRQTLHWDVDPSRPPGSLRAGEVGGRNLPQDAVAPGHQDRALHSGVGGPQPRAVYLVLQFEINPGVFQSILSTQSVYLCHFYFVWGGPSPLKVKYIVERKKYRPVLPSTEPVPSYINQYCSILKQYHQVSINTDLCWPSAIINQPVLPSTDPVPPAINQYQPILLLIGDYRLLQ